MQLANSTPLQSWDLIRAFLALHRAGTFEGAGQLLRVDHSTLRRRIQTLEQNVGATLFVRHDGLYSVMPGMRSLLEAAIQMEASSQVFLEGASAVDSGTVRVTMLDVFAGWLAPDIAHFRHLYPEIQLDISTEHHFVDLERDMVDVAIRLARPTRGSSRLRKLGTIDYAIYAAPDYLAWRKTRDPGADEALLTLSVHFTHRDHDFLVGEMAWSLAKLPRGRIVTATDSYLVLRELCEAGMGLALIPCVLGDRSETLVRFGGDIDASCDVWSVAHANTGSTGRVRLFLNFIHDAFRRNLSSPSSIACGRSSKGLGERLEGGDRSIELD